MGGLLGLCLGFSFVSMAEVLYHFVLKLFFGQITVYKDLRNKRTNKVDVRN